ncbi:hypothetical protein C8R47DRAFT_1155123, partial [Mycena vitilis]
MSEIQLLLSFSHHLLFVAPSLPLAPPLPPPPSDALTTAPMTSSTRRSSAVEAGLRWLLSPCTRYLSARFPLRNHPSRSSLQRHPGS